MAPNKYLTKMTALAKPELGKIYKDLTSIVGGMHDSLKNIERVDKLVFPLLSLTQPNLNTPDVKKN